MPHWSARRPRLEAYESFLGDDPALAAPLRTLLAVGASERLTTGERTEFLNAVDQQATQGTAGVEFMGRGPITFTERNADLPVTLVNNRAAPATVVLELTSDRIDFTHEERPAFTLEPGRNDLIVPVEAAASGRTTVRVTVTTPNPAGAITITTGIFQRAIHRRGGSRPSDPRVGCSRAGSVVAADAAPTFSRCRQRQWYRRCTRLRPRQRRRLKRGGNHPFDRRPYEDMT